MNTNLLSVRRLRIAIGSVALGAGAISTTLWKIGTATGPITELATKDVAIVLGVSDAFAAGAITGMLLGVGVAMLTGPSVGAWIARNRSISRAATERAQAARQKIDRK